MNSSVDSVDGAGEDPRVALVTGAAGILGPTICSALKEAGWKVAAAELNTESFALYERIQQKPFPADLLVTGDLSQRENCFRIVKETVEHFGSLSLLVNTATAVAEGKSLDDMTEEHVNRQLGVDLLAPLYLTQAAVGALEKSKGLVVNFSSVLKENYPLKRMIYCVAKAGIEQMTTHLAIELSARGIRVNTIRVGSIPGDAFLRPALQALPDDLARTLYNDILPKHLAEVGGVLTGDTGRPSDIASMILHLASKEGAYINAAVLPVDGGFTASRIRRSWQGGQGRSTYASRFNQDWKAELRQWLKEKGIEHEI